MKIELRDMTVGELVDDYKDDGEGGVRGYGGKLDIRRPSNGSSYTRTSSATPS